MVRARVVREAEVGEDEAGGELGDALLGGVGGGAEAATKIAVEAVGSSGRVRVMPISA